MMPTLHLSKSMIEDYVAKFSQFGPWDQVILLNRLKELMRENDFFPEKQNDEKNSDDVDQHQTL